MKPLVCSFKARIAIIGVLSGVVASASGPRSVVEIESGTATFDSSTNMPGVEVKGKSTSLTGQVEVSQEGSDLALQKIEATLPIKTLATGMKVRDEHMRKYIFTTADGKEPDLNFTADSGTCKGSSARDFSCQISGNFTLRGEARPLTINLKVKDQSGSATAFRAEGDGVLKLSDYGIAPPSQFGVKPGNEVKIHLEFTGKQKAGTTAALGAK